MRLAVPPQPPKGTVRPSGPKYLRLTRDPPILTGPGEPPPGFINGNNSPVEWYVWWALDKLKVPFIYQAKIAGGRHIRGGSVPDFLVTDRSPELIIRVQTSRYHIAVAAHRQKYDIEQRRVLERLGYQVIDVFEEHFYGRREYEDGAAVLSVVRDALNGKQRPSPIATATSRARG